jgi:proteasome lid subunit RPN8/RPN11
MSGETPWVGGDVVFPAPILKAIEAHCRVEYPNEACGFALGPTAEPRRISRAQKAVNAQEKYHARFPEEFTRTARTAYFIEPKIIMDTFDQAKAAGDAVKVIYHSHTDHDSYFSEEDHRAATFGDDLAYPVAFLVVSVREGEVRDRKLFAWEPSGRRFVEVSVQVLP